jgi:hypothetical protein
MRARSKTALNPSGRQKEDSLSFARKSLMEIRILGFI